MYAFGVLMLRMATNLPAIMDAGSPRSTSLNEHVRRALFRADWEGHGAAAAGGRRPEDVPHAAWAALAPTDGLCAWDDRMLASFGALALRCTEAAPESRPPMADVVAGLESLLSAPEAAPGVAPEPPLSRSGDCWICMEANRDTEFLPCHHMVACSPCAQELLRRDTRCPFCRQQVVAVAPTPAERADTFVPSGEGPPLHAVAAP